MAEQPAERSAFETGLDALDLLRHVRAKPRADPPEPPAQPSREQLLALLDTFSYRPVEEARPTKGRRRDSL